MARRLLIAGNWKMNKTVAEGTALAKELKDKVGQVTDVDILVCPPLTTVPAVVAELDGSTVCVGAQNVHWEESGAYTGEVSAAMLKDTGVTHVIIGHSERRQYFGETDDTVNKRMKAALAGGLTPIVCFGETLEQREADETEAVVKAQIAAGLADISADQMAATILAYEPVWAIGTGRTATPEQAQDVHELVRSLLRARFGDIASNVRILYGGSMKPGNAAELLGKPDIDGGLIGGASLKADDFAGIVLCDG